MICFCTSLSKIFEIADRILPDRILTEYLRESQKWKYLRDCLKSLDLKFT